MKTSPPQPILAPFAGRRSIATLRGLAGTLGLDAALLLGGWTALLQLEGGDLAPVAPVLAALAAALAYLGDHLLDARRLADRPELAARHRQARRHRRVLERVWALALTASLALALARLPSATLGLGLGLAATAALYLGACARWPRRLRSWPPRELAVGFFFAAGAGLLVGSAGRIVDLVLFGLLCALDALAVAAREAVADRALGEVSSATRWPRTIERLPAMAVALALGAALAGATRLASPGIAAAVLLAAAGVALVARDDGRARRHSVDLVVTLPALLVIVARHVL